MFENVEIDLDDAILEDNDEDDESDDEAAAGRSRVQFRNNVPRIASPLRANRGVNSAMLRTPAGNAELRLPQSVVSLEVFNRAIASLRESHNKLSAEVSANRDAIKKTVSETALISTSTRKALVRQKKQTEQTSMMNMLLGIMMQQQVSRRIDAIPGAPAATNDSMMMMLPFMMMGDNAGGSGDNSMMLMMIMMMGMGK